MTSLRLILLAALMLTADMFAATWSFSSPLDGRCTCRSRDGSKYELGQTTCIRVGDVAYLARCEMELNVTTWRKLGDACPEARAQSTHAFRFD